MLGDCASITNHDTGRPYSPTAQHAIRQGKVAAENIILAVKGKKGDKDKVKFDYKTKGIGFVKVDFGGLAGDHSLADHRQQWSAAAAQ